MRATELKKVKEGEFFRLKESDTAPVWIKGYYYKPEKVFEAYKFEDTNKEVFLKGSRLVFVDFEF